MEGACADRSFSREAEVLEVPSGLLSTLPVTVLNSSVCRAAFAEWDTAVRRLCPLGVDSRQTIPCRSRSR